MTEILLIVYFHSCCHANNIARFLVTKLITLVKKLFNTCNNSNTSIVLLNLYIAFT
ncbi:hypothetical protein CSC18_2815 [Klebsiella aerogenes]|nr:hypothetical protein CSC18_2815 [Klebsiella aerogenes]